MTPSTDFNAGPEPGEQTILGRTPSANRPSSRVGLVASLACGAVAAATLVLGLAAPALAAPISGGSTPGATGGRNDHNPPVCVWDQQLNIGVCQSVPGSGN
jgi:hypothetical protein